LEFICSPAGESACWRDHLLFEIWDFFLCVLAVIFSFPGKKKAPEGLFLDDEVIVRKTSN
jgi:hypothetical protein